eukprot:COSAG05_NODE_806_length_7193_cov_10.079786_6_plen_212_part_00
MDLETDEWYCLACWDNASDDTGDTDDTARGDDAPGTIQFRKIVPQPEPEPEEQPQVVDLCANCERRLPGRVDPDDEEFYCHECWLELEEELEASPEQRVQGTSVARIFHNASSDGSGVLSFNECATETFAIPIPPTVALSHVFLFSLSVFSLSVCSRACVRACVGLRSGGCRHRRRPRAIPTPRISSTCARSGRKWTRTRTVPWTYWNSTP